MKLSGKRPDNLGVHDGKLAPCPWKPNCVSSQADPGDKGHYIAPLGFSGDPKAAMRKLKSVIEKLPRAEIIESKPDYLYAEFSSQLLGFVDDVELYCDGKVIHARSASRLGIGDLGVNRKRVEAIRAALGTA